MDGSPLAGRAFSFGGRTPALRVSRQILEELGARVSEAAPGTACDVGEPGMSLAPLRVALSGYGVRGRFAGEPEDDIAVEAIGGALMGQWTYAPGPAYLLTPFATIAHALLSTIATLAHGLGGRTEPYEVSALQSLLAIQSGFYSYGTVNDPARWRHTPRGQSPTYSTYLATDGWLFLGASTISFMFKVFNALELDDLLADPRMHDGPRSPTARAMDGEIRERIGAIIGTRPREAWLALMKERKVPAGPVLSIEEALAHPQTRASGLVTEGPDGVALSNPVTVARGGDAAPRARPVGPRPLSGLRVVELAGYIAGPYVGRLLADLGADVIKVEPLDGDPFRPNGYSFVAWNHGKRSMSLDLRSSAGKAHLERLVAGADVLVTNYRPEALDRMGVGREALFTLNPALIHCTVAAFGETGPLADLSGFDPIVQGFAGIMQRQGGDGEPVKSQMAATDYLSAMLGTIGILAALTGQAERGGGYVVRTSLLAAALLLNYFVYDDLRDGRPYSRGGRDFPGPSLLNGLSRTADGWLLTLADERRPGESMQAAERYLRGDVGQEATADALARLKALNVAAVRCLDPETLPEAGNLDDDGLWMTVEQSEMGPVTVPAPVLGPIGEAPAPLCGADNAALEADSPWRAEVRAAAL